MHGNLSELIIFRAQRSDLQKIDRLAKSEGVDRSKFLRRLIDALENQNPIAS